MDKLATAAKEFLQQAFRQQETEQDLQQKEWDKEQNQSCCQGGFHGAIRSCLGWGVKAVLLLIAPSVLATINAPTNFRTDAADFSDLALPVGAIQAQLRWSDNADNETAYQVEVSSNGSTYYLSRTLSANSIGDDTEIIPWTSNRWYRVRAVNATEQSSYAGPIQIFGYMPPTRLGGSTADATHMTVTWDTSGGYVDGYTVQRATNAAFSQDLVQYFVSGQTTATYTINFSFVAGVTYYFRVASTNSSIAAPNGNSEFEDKPISYLACAPNGPPVSPHFVSENMDATPNEAFIYFDDVALNTTGWKLDYSTNGGSTWFGVAVTFTGATRYSVTQSGLTGGMPYAYRLAATNSSGASAYTTWNFQPPLTPAGSPTVWYIDAAASGNATGTNWANAWPSWGSINWSSLGAGHTVYVSGGNYTNYVVTFADGAFGNPITIKTATNAPHNGHVYVYGELAWKSSYVTIDGAKDDGYGFSIAEQVPANINLTFTQNSGAEPVALAFKAQGAVLKWAELTGAGSPISGEGDGDGLDVLPDTVGPTNCLFHALWIHDVYGSAINQVRHAGYTAAHEVIFSYLLMKDYHNNCFASGGSFDMTNCFWAGWKSPGVGHPDGVQGGIDQSSIIGCRMNYNCPSGSPLYPDLGSQTGQTNFYFVNNLIYGDTLDMQFSLTAAAILCILSNINIIGNTFYGNSQSTLSFITGGTTGRVLQGSAVMNNLWFTGTNGLNGAGGFSSGGTQYNPSDLIFNYNVVCGPSKVVSYRTNNTAGIGDAGVFTFATAEAFDAWSSSYKSNSSSSAQFLRQYLNEFDLYGADTVALDRGTNLSSLAGMIPAITKDVVGSSRGLGSGWDIGAYEHDPSLVLYFDFETFTNGRGSYVEDRSGHANHAWAVTNATMVSSDGNYCPLPIVGAVGNYAGAFRLKGTNEQWQVYHDNLGYQIGDWLGVTNWNGIDFLTNGTFAMWYAETNTDGPGDATPWGAGWINSPADDNTLDISRYNYDNLTFTTFSNSTRRAALSVPNLGTGVWNHFAFTWNGTNNTTVCYTNGQVAQTNTLLVPYLHIANSGAHNAIIGASTHGGSYLLGDDQFPNNGWFAGWLDEMRIYNRDLSAGEIGALYSGGAAPVSGGSGGGNTPAFSPIAALGKSSWGKAAFGQ